MRGVAAETQQKPAHIQNRGLKSAHRQTRGQKICSHTNQGSKICSRTNQGSKICSHTTQGCSSQYCEPSPEGELCFQGQDEIPACSVPGHHPHPPALPKPGWHLCLPRIYSVKPSFLPAVKTPELFMGASDPCWEGHTNPGVRAQEHH